MGSTDKSFSNAGYEPKDHFLTGTYVESRTESMTEERLPEQRLPEQRLPEQRFPQWVRCSSMHTENKSITPSEEAFLFLSRRPCPIDRGNPLSK